MDAPYSRASPTGYKVLKQVRHCRGPARVGDGQDLVARASEHRVPGRGWSSRSGRNGTGAWQFALPSPDPGSTCNGGWPPLSWIRNWRWTSF